MNVKEVIEKLDKVLAKTSVAQMRAIVSGAMESGDPGLVFFSEIGLAIEPSEFSFSMPAYWEACVTSDEVDRPVIQKQVEEIAALESAADSNELSLAA